MFLYGKEDIIRFLIENGDINLNEQNYFLIGNNQHIFETATQLGRIFPNQFDYVRKNPFIECTNSIFLQSLAQYYFVEDFSEYDVLNNLFPPLYNAHIPSESILPRFVIDGSVISTE